MDDLTSIWWYQEKTDELNQKVTMMTLELEQAKREANEEINKQKLTIGQLEAHLNKVSQERDEAKEQLEMLWKLLPLQTQPGSPVIIPGKTNSSITDTNSLHEASNHQSPIESFFDATSPDFSTMNIPNSSCIGLANQPFPQEINGTMPGNIISNENQNIDWTSAYIDEVTRGRELPPQGKLFPLMEQLSKRSLCRLLMVGNIPKWNVPPTRPFNFPSIPCSNRLESGYTNQKLVMNPHICSASANFETDVSGSYMSSRRFSAPGISSITNQIPLAKHPRIQ